ncbi:MAG TPA: isoprenylcysteine carboxylmethyltransferase family protein [Acidobacteriaceae bacterium]|nr:isoprenylcysteine carboxylmethyltransferase family protein [Acidobacteriaceae bacterium]
MKATPYEFRARFWILVAIFALGFVAPWDYWLHLDGTGPNTHVWGRLAIELSRAGVNISVAFNLILAFGIACAFAGAALRTWASACLGPDVVRGGDLHGEQMVVTGPYRYVRNPLYLGSWLNALALALLMPPTGAVLTLVLVVAFELRLVLAEEAYLAANLGQTYADYRARVPQLLPAWRPRVAAAGTSPRWGMAALAEIFLWGTAVSFAAVGWQYNAHLLIQCVLVSLGLSLVVRGVSMQPQTA